METNTMTIALLGAGGKMGCRLTDNLMRHPEYDMRYIETGASGIERLAQRGLAPAVLEESLPVADIVILALPDTALGTVSHQLVPDMKPGSILITLDPAAAHAGVLARRGDIVLFVAHPLPPSALER